MLDQASLTMEFSEIDLEENSIRTYETGESLVTGCVAGMHLTFANVEASFFLTLQGNTCQLWRATVSEGQDQTVGLKGELGVFTEIDAGDSPALS